MKKLPEAFKMNKQTADKYIYEYRDRIFGFAMSKAGNIDGARDLASDIICEVYSSFLRSDNIVNLDGYVYRISRNVWAKFAQRLIQGKKFENIDDLVLPYYDNADEDETVMLENLRREIGYLSDRQRQVVYMHYYENFSVDKISKKLNISNGTVKWHLSDARGKLKEGITMSINEKNLDINPIRFTFMGHGGEPGTTGETSDMFDTRLKQNIAYACYHQPKTLEEISRELGVPQAYIADNLEKLVEYAYIDRLDNSKNPRYRTNMVISGPNAHNINGVLDKAADFLCEKFYPQAIEDFINAPDHYGFSCCDNDVNFLLYGFMLAWHHRFAMLLDYDDVDRFQVKRPDGGKFIAYASVSEDVDVKNDTDYDLYWTQGIMIRSKWCKTSDETHAHECAYESIMANCRFTDRSGGWRDNRSADWEALINFIVNGKDSLSPEEYKRITDKGYIYRDVVQPVIFKAKLSGNETLSFSAARLLEKKIPFSEEFISFSKELDEEAFSIMKDDYPEHIRPIIKAVLCTGVISRPGVLPRCIERLLEKGFLKPLTDVQKKAALVILEMK